MGILEVLVLGKSPFPLQHQAQEDGAIHAAASLPSRVPSVVSSYRREQPDGQPLRNADQPTSYPTGEQACMP